MLGKLNVSHIVRDHLRTLRVAGTSRPDWLDIMQLGVAPIAIATLLVWSEVWITGELGDALITAVAILGGFHLNLLLVIYDLLGREGNSVESERRRKLLEETFSNIAFLVLSAVVLLTLLVGKHLIDFEKGESLHRVSDWIIYAIASTAVATTLMVVKRIYVLLTIRLRRDAGS